MKPWHLRHLQYNSVVDHRLMVRYVIRLIPHRGPTELFFNPTGLTKAVTYTILSVYIALVIGMYSFEWDSHKINSAEIN